jgi:hypothetical protein
MTWVADARFPLEDTADPHEIIPDKKKILT